MAGPSAVSLARWSCIAKKLPAISKIKSLHIYDFDNTLFQTPLPNPKLWTPHTLGYLHSEDAFVGGGWWHDDHILEATGEGLEKEEPRAWAGWWNEHIVHLVQLSMEQEDALTILLTGRGESRYSDIIKRMVNSKKLDFDMICLKPSGSPSGQRFKSTMAFKQLLLEDALTTYREAEEIRIYEDRPKHVVGFRDFLEKLNRRYSNGEIPLRREAATVEVIRVAAESKTLDPVAEVVEVQRMVNAHNAAVQNKTNLARPERLQIKRTVFFTGYLIGSADTEKLQDLVSLIPPTGPDTDLKYLATNILITPRPATDALLARVGGMGAKQIWQVNGVGCYQNSVWAVRCTPIPASASYYTEASGPIIVLAHRRQAARPADASRITQWQTVPTSQQIVFETTVGEKSQLRIEKEIEGETELDSLYARERAPNFGINKRKHDDMSDHRNRNEDRRNSRGRGPRDRGGHSGGRGYAPRDRRERDSIAGSGGGRGRGGDRGGASRPRGRGGYRSLDDVGGSHSSYNDGQHRARPPPDYDAGGYNAGAARSGGNDGAYDDLMY